MAQVELVEYQRTINNSDGSKHEVKPGDYVLTEATGLKSVCSETDLETNKARIDADILVRDAQIEANRQQRVVATDKETLGGLILGENVDLENVTSNLNLVTSMPSGSIVGWTSDNVAVATDGTVTRPIGADVTAILTAAIAYEAASDTIDIIVVVKQQ